MNLFRTILDSIRKTSHLDSRPLRQDYRKALQLAQDVIATVNDEKTALLQEQYEAQRLLERYRMIFEDSIIGLSFYSPKGKLIASNKIMRQICNFDTDEGDGFFSNACLFDVPPFNEVLDRNNVSEFWGCFLSIIPERNMHVYLEIRVHPVCDKDGRITYISVAVRDITAEREMYTHVKENDLRLQKVSDAIQLYESELRYMLEACDMRVWRITFADRMIRFYRGLTTIEREMSLDELSSFFIDDKDYPREHFEHPEAFFGHFNSYLCHTRSIFHERNSIQWNQIDSIPVYDDHGQLVGGFGLIRNVTELMEKQEQLRHETQRANESGQMKSVFLANMTHEIRTPLNAIVGFSDVLPLLTTTEEKQESIKVIMNNCDMLLRLVNDIISASKMESGGVRVNQQNIDFALLFSQLCDSLRSRVDDAGLQFLTDMPCEHFMASVDANCISQVVTNFLINAVKYTHQGYVRLGWRPMPSDELPSPQEATETSTLQEGLYIYCEDTGEGIAPEVQGRIFERFFKVNEYIQGTGLGLAICKAIADACHGRIGLQSAGQDQGTLFWLWIPLTPNP